MPLVKRNGEPITSPKHLAYLARQREALNRTFWQRVIVSEAGCWDYQGIIGKQGYGKIVRAGKKINAHKFAWELTVGPVPNGLLVCHHCDNRRCINPNHLFLGTPADNMRDMAAKGRACTKLTPEQVRRVRELRAQGRLLREIVAEFEVSFSTIQKLLQGRSYGQTAENRRGRLHHVSPHARGGG